MGWTDPDSTPTGSFTATRWNTYIRDNLAALHDIQTLYATNKTGAALALGAVVAVRTSSNAEVEATTTVGDRRRIGVATASQADNALGYIGVTGRLATVLTTGTVNRGDPLQTSATTQRAQAGRAGAFAVALTSATGTSSVAALLLNAPVDLDTRTPTTKTTAGAATYTAAELLTKLILRDPSGAPRTDTLPTAALLVAALQNPQVGDWLEFYLRNDAGAANAVTLAAGSGGTVYTGSTLVIPQGQTGHYGVRLTNVGSGTEAYTLYSLSVGTH